MSKTICTGNPTGAGWGFTPCGAEVEELEQRPNFNWDDFCKGCPSCKTKEDK